MVHFTLTAANQAVSEKKKKKNEETVEATALCVFHTACWDSADMSWKVITKTVPEIEEIRQTTFLINVLAC